ncbi:MAG: hypothetical protein PHT62_06565 [Desulfotomaculaceae bacterium]|nr:hypothetical protein [Desulfotomaculaceae bacterium]
MEKKVEQLSGGSAPGTYTAHAYHSQAEAVLLDEHSAALDPSIASDVLHLKRDIVAKQELSTIMITHNMKAALEHGIRTIMMHVGRIILDIEGKERDAMMVKA